MIDKELVRKRFAKALKSYSDNAAIQQEIARRMVLMLSSLGCDFTRVFEVGCGSGVFTRAFLEKFSPDELILNDLCPEAEMLAMDSLKSTKECKLKFLSGDAEKIDFPQCNDLVVSCSVIQWFESVRAFLDKAAQSLSPGGVLALSTFGEDNLYQISSLTGVSLDYLSVDSLKGMCPESMQVVLASESIDTLYFKTPVDVVRHLKLTGVTGISARKWTKTDLERFSYDYVERFGTSDGQPLTYHPIYLIMRKKADF